LIRDSHGRRVVSRRSIVSDLFTPNFADPHTYKADALACRLY
jgi:hypothetical protein